jgi:type IV pilus assembly protein PilV
MVRGRNMSMTANAQRACARLLRSGQAGFSLIEALIALTVLSIGLLAIAGMQTFALTVNVDSNDMSVVTNLAADMMERIRFNWKNATQYNGSLGTGIDTQNALTQPPATQPMARGDFAQWQARLAASGLTGARGIVMVTTSGPPALSQNLVTVVINWTSATASMRKHGSAGADSFILRNYQYVLTTMITPT